MRVAFVSGTPAFPPVEGNRARILNLARAVQSQGHHVYFIYLPTWSLTDVDATAHNLQFGDDRFIRLRGEVLRGRAPLGFRVKRKGRRLLGSSARFYNHLDEFMHKGWLDQLKIIDKQIGFDVVFVEYVFHSKALQAFPDRCLKVLDTHDRFTDRHLSFTERAGQNAHWFSIPAWVEVAGFRRADVVLAIQDSEAAAFRNRLGTAPPVVLTVSHIADVSTRVQDYFQADALFIGSENTANVVSVTEFIRRILPLVVDELPLFRLVLAGSICSVVPDHPAVLKLGMVKRTIEAYRRAPIAISPMLVGTGIAIKLLEAMAAGVVTVATRTGARGLTGAEAAAVRVFDDDDYVGFASSLVGLAASEEKRRLAGQAAYSAAVAWNKRQVDSLRQTIDLALRTDRLQS